MNDPRRSIPEHYNPMAFRPNAYGDNRRRDTFSDSRVEQLRIPPQSIDAEQAVIGGLMLAPDAFDRIADRLNEEDFYRRDHQLIYRAIRELAEKSRPYDAVTLGEWFESQGLSEQVAGGAYLVELASTTPSAANITAYAEIVRDKAILRQLIDTGTGIVNDAFQPDGRDSDEILSKAEMEVFAISEARSQGRTDFVAINKAMDQHRRQGRTTELPEVVSEDDAGDFVEPAEKADRNLDVADTKGMVDTSLSRLNERYAMALRLRMIDDKSREECAQILGITVGNFDVLLHRAAKAFRKVYPP